MAKSSNPKRKKAPKTVLKLPDLEQSKSAVLNSLVSASSQRSYDHAIREFIEWYCSEPRLAFNKTVVTRYRIALDQRHYAPSTINLRLAAVRRLAYEASDSGLLSPDLAAGLRRVKGVRRLGVEIGNWLTAEEGRRLLSGGGNKSLEVLKPVGKLISISGPPDPDFAKDRGASWFLKFVMSLLSSGIRKKAKRHRVSYSFLFMRASGEQLSKITSLIDAGVIRPVVNRVFPFESTGEALAYVETGRAKGKVVVKVDKSGVASGNRLPRLFPGVVALSRSERTRSRTGISARGYLFP